jgi:hypothetical protein
MSDQRGFWNNPWIQNIIGGILVSLLNWAISRWWAARHGLTSSARTRRSHPRASKPATGPPRNWLRATARPVHLTARTACRLATLSGLLAGLCALFFYRAFLPWWLASHHLTAIAGMVEQAWSDTGNTEVFRGMVAGALGGLLISTTSIWRRRLRRVLRLLLDLAATLIGGGILAAAQLGIGHASVPWHLTHWPEFFAFGAAATLVTFRRIDFSNLKVRDILDGSVVPSLVGGILFGAVAAIRALPWVPPVPTQPGYEGWLFATIVTCPFYVGILVALTYLQARLAHTSA